MSLDRPPSILGPRRPSQMETSREAEFHTGLVEEGSKKLRFATA